MGERTVAGGFLCGACGQSKPVAEFRLLRSGSRASWCRSCQNEATRGWRARNHDSINALRRAAFVGAEHPVITCAICETPFRARSTQSRYCSKACNRRAYRARRAA